MMSHSGRIERYRPKSANDPLNRMAWSWHRAFEAACKFDGLPTDTKFAAFSHENPFSQFVDIAARQFAEMRQQYEAGGYIGLTMNKAAKVRHVLGAQQTRNHKCHWPECELQVPPAVWGCRKHWFMLPKSIRDRIWNAYRIGQETDRSPAREYVTAARAAQDWINTKGPL